MFWPACQKFRAIAAKTRVFQANRFAGGLGAAIARMTRMSSLQNIYMKMTPDLDPAGLANLHHDLLELPPDVQKKIGRDVAHELNNILTIIRGYADRILMKHGENQALRPDLQLIADNAKRAEVVIRHATLPRPRAASRAALAHSAV
jgi:signal transduction histidine kinase